MQYIVSDLVDTMFVVNNFLQTDNVNSISYLLRRLIAVDYYF